MSQNLESNEPMQTAALDEDMVKTLFDRAEIRRAARIGANRPEARGSLARDWRMSFWTLTNWRRGRLKRLRSQVTDLVRACLVNEIKKEIEGLTRELNLALECGRNPSETEVARLRDAIEAAQKLVGEVRDDG
jgi:hypothetical protein